LPPTSSAARRSEPPTDPCFSKRSRRSLLPVRGDTTPRHAASRFVTAGAWAGSRQAPCQPVNVLRRTDTKGPLSGWVR
jgi:hypothetical protein